MIVLLYLVVNLFFYFFKTLLHAKASENKIILKVENELITNYEIKE